jgi:isopenicillin N synthase-like dioxygenase
MPVSRRVTETISLQTLARLGPSCFSTILNKAFKKAWDNKHTDIGTLSTLLFTEQWRLQLQRPGSDEWDFVAPRDGHAIVNVGDSLRFLSEKKFNSCLHRVIPVTSNEDRYSIAYFFLRPENETRFKDIEGRKVKAVECQWHDDKYVMFAEPHDRQERSHMLTAGMEKNSGILVN